MSSLAKVNSILEKFWWAMTAVSFIMVLVLCFMQGWDKWGFYLIIPVVTAVMAIMRRFLRKRLEKSEAERDRNQAESDNNASN
jgi:membrane protein implicated in regulation of membrane protease activity